MYPVPLPNKCIVGSNTLPHFERDTLNSWKECTIYLNAYDPKGKEASLKK